MVLDWAKDWVIDKVYDVAKTGIQAGGNMAGNVVGGVGTLVENSGRGLGESTSGISGAIGGVGGYINNYGQGIIDSTAASGSGGGEKKKAIKPTQAVPNGVANVQSSARRSLPTTTSRPSTLSKPANSNNPNPLATNNKSAISKPLNQPSKPPPPAPNRNLPTKKPSSLTSQKPVAPSILSRTAAAASDKTPDGKVRISPASRPGPVRSRNTVISPTKPPNAPSTPGPKPLPRIAAAQNTRGAGGKTRVSAQSRPRTAVSAR